jgi:hypothetical protein
MEADPLCYVSFATDKHCRREGMVELRREQPWGCCRRELKFGVLLPRRGVAAMNWEGAI